MHWGAEPVSHKLECIGTMNRSESPSTALRAPPPPLGEKDGMRGYGSWKGNRRRLMCWRKQERGQPCPRELELMQRTAGKVAADVRRLTSPWRRSSGRPYVGCYNLLNRPCLTLARI